MLLHLIRKELLDHLLSLRFIILAVFSALVVWASLYSGITYYEAVLDDYRTAETTTERRIRQIIEADDRISLVGHNWDELYGQGYTIHKPPTVLSTFVRGIDPFLGRSTHVAVSGDDRPITWSPASQDPTLASPLPLDLTTVIQIALGLFVLLLTYDAISGEKERGTLRLAGSFPIARAQFLLAKLVGAALPMLAVYASSTGLGIAVLLMVPTFRLGPAESGRLILILVASAVYLGTMASAGVLASAMTRSAATSFALLMAFWTVSIVVLPRLSLVLASALTPPPSKSDYVARKRVSFRENLNERNTKHAKFIKDYEQRTGSSPFGTPEGREAYYLAVRGFDREFRPFMRDLRDRIEEEYRNRFDAWIDLGAVIAHLSPAFPFRAASVRLAGTGSDRYRDFSDENRRHLDDEWDWVKEGWNRDFLMQWMPEKYGEFSWQVADIPRFRYEEKWPAADIRSALIETGAVALWGLLFSAGAFVTMIRYDLR